MRVLAFIMLMGLIACGQKQNNELDGIPAIVETNGSVEAFDNLTYYEELINRPKCDEKLDKVMVYVNEDNTFYKCDADNNEWKIIVFISERND